nr:hypothetical protein CFP56_75061 [Quercus suber]
MLRHYFQGNFKETSGYDMIIPGSKIPKWFSHHSEGASLNLQVPSLLSKDSKNKRRRGHDDYDGAGPSEEGSFNDLLHPKRIRLPNIIERFVPRLGNLIGNLSTQDDSDDEKSQ